MTLLGIKLQQIVSAVLFLLLPAAVCAKRLEISLCKAKFDPSLAMAASGVRFSTLALPSTPWTTYVRLLLVWQETGVIAWLSRPGSRDSCAVAGLSSARGSGLALAG